MQIHTEFGTLELDPAATQNAQEFWKKERGGQDTVTPINESAYVLTTGSVSTVNVKLYLNGITGVAEKDQEVFIITCTGRLTGTTYPMKKLTVHATLVEKLYSLATSLPGQYDLIFIAAWKDGMKLNFKLYGYDKDGSGFDMDALVALIKAVFQPE